MADGVADMFDDQSSDGYSSGEDRRRSKKPTVSSTRRRQYSDDDEEDEEEEEEEKSLGKKSRRSESSEDSEDYEYTKKKPAARKAARKKRARTNNFLDIEASVDTDEEEDEDEDGALGDFIVDNEAELASAEKDALRHRSTMRGPAGVFADEDEDEDAEAIEARLRARYSGYGNNEARGGGAAMAGAAAGDGDWVPQRLLIPGVRDPHLWACACLQGKERDIVLAAARRVFQWQGSNSGAKFAGVYSAFCRDGLTGHVYVEARSQAEARSALEGIPGVFVSKLALVPLSDMVDVVRIKARAPRINPGAWVRVRRGNYAGDLAQVVAVIEASDAVEVRLVPRLDYDGAGGAGAGGAKGERPAPRLFSAEDARRGAGSLTSRQNEIVWRGDRFVAGYLHKDMRVAALALHAAPTLDEIARFAGDGGDGGGGDGDSAAAIAALATAAAAADIGGPAEARDLAPGDGVEVVDGDMAGAVGVVSSIDGAVVRVDVAALRGGSGGSGMGFAAHQLRKRFAPGDHVKVLAGRHRGATGMVLDASAAVVAVLADVGGAELRVLARDLRVSSDVSAPSGGTGGAVQAVVGLDVHDLVLLDGGQPAVVTRVAADALTVLDDRGETRSVAPRDARPARASSDRAGVDCAGAPLRRGDAVREISGARRDGAVLQVTRFVAFVLPRGGSGLFVARTRQLEPAAPRAAPRTMGPPQALAAGARGGRGGGRGGSARGGRGGGRDALVGRTVVATRGPYKGYIGMAKDATGDSVRVELHTNARIVSIDRDKLAVRLPSGDTVPAVDFGASAAAPPPPPAAAANGWAAPPPPRADARSPAPAYGGWGDARSPAPAPAASASSAWHTPAGTGAAASSWGTPAATASGWGDVSAATPASSGGWGDAMAATPASSGGGGWGDTAPQSSVAPVTPAGGGLPQTPGGPFPQTPGATTTTSSSSGGGGDNAFFAWAVPRAVVVLGATRQRGTLTEVAAARAQAIVRLADGSTQVIDRSSLPRLDPQPMRAEKRDRVIVIRGPRRGATGSMVGRDGSEAFFQPDGDSAWHPEPLRNLAVYDDNKRQ